MRKYSQKQESYMIKTINELLDVIGELEHKETPIHYIYSFLGGKEKLELPKEWLTFNSSTEEIKQHFLSKPPQDMPIYHFLKDRPTIPKIKALLEQHISRGVKESFLIISTVLAVDLVLKFYTFGYRDGLAKQKQLLAKLKDDLKRTKEPQKVEEELDQKRLKNLIAHLEKESTYDKEKEAIFARDYVIWRKLTGLDNGIDFFHDYGDLTQGPRQIAGDD